MRRRGGVAAIAVVVAAVLVAAGVVVWLTRPRERVVFVGDSIMDGLRPIVESRYHIDDNSLKAVPGKTIDDMMEAATGLAASNPTQAVIDLGTNDVLANEPAGPNGAMLTRMVELFPTAKCVHLVTINEHMLSPTFGNVGSAAAALNQQMAAIAQSHPNVRIVDWDKTVLDQDAAHDPDGPITIDTVHPTPMGQQLLVDDIQRSTDHC
jgi:lysophospholipase L1-like esterase